MSFSTTVELQLPNGPAALEADESVQDTLADVLEGGLVGDGSVAVIVDELDGGTSPKSVTVRSTTLLWPYVGYEWSPVTWRYVRSEETLMPCWWVGALLRGRWASSS